MSVRLLPGLALALALALVAWGLGVALPLIGGAVFGIVLGAALANLVRLPQACVPGVRFAGREMLKASIIMLGFGLNLGQVLRTGLESLSVTLGTVVVALVTAALLGRALGVPRRLRILVGVGTAICGGSAIAAAAPIVRAEDHETAFAISTVFLFNVIALLIFPALGHLLGLSDAGFGLWAGTAINDTSSVVAAGYIFSEAAGDQATIVKLTRASLILPVCLGLVAVELRRARAAGPGVSARRIFPWFILWFVLAAALSTAGLVPAAWLGAIRFLAVFLIVLALTAIGLGTDLRRMAATGARPILLGLAVWVAVATSALALQALEGQW